MTNERQRRLLNAAAIFLFLYSLILTLSPAVRERNWNVDYRLSHWIGYFLWLAIFRFAHRRTADLLPDHDPYLLPAAALLSGWGMLTIWRLDSSFGIRQGIWLLVAVIIFIAGLKLPEELTFLRKYKYLLLSGNILLTALTLIFGANPGGFGPRLWLGCCGVYFQPSEPLKLLLIIYLASYFAGYSTVRLNSFPLILPSAIVAGLALLILIVQRDLGTASIFILLFTVILFIVTGKRRVLLLTAGALLLSGLIGYFFIDIIHARMESWLNPWNDPSGRSYQIIQSLIAVANGGIFGRGPGLGSPGLVPVAISDFIFTAIAEETGLIGSLGLVALIGLILSRGLIAALRAPDNFRRLLAAGLTAYLGIQSLLIIGGNLRLFPLTGVTLPFVSYGGSSLATSFIALLLLLKIGGQIEVEPAPLPNAAPYNILAGLLGLGLIAIAFTGAWWAIVRGADLLTRTDNGRRSIADRYVPRGSLLDRSDAPINITRGKSGSYQREYLYPDLAPITGYTNPIFGQAGLEAVLDEYLRGEQGNSASSIWYNHLLYGMPPPGIDIRLSIDLPLQQRADKLLGDHQGAIILMNAQNGEILVMASHPAYDPNKLNEIGARLAQDPAAPLVNRAAQGSYLLGGSIAPLFTDSKRIQDINQLYAKLGLFSEPKLYLPVAPAGAIDAETVHASPLQTALAAATLSNHGIRPSPRIALAVNTPQQGWVVLPPLSEPIQAIPQAAADSQALKYIVAGQPYWEFTVTTKEKNLQTTWYLGGTPPDWQGAPLTVAVLLENSNNFQARKIGSELLKAALNPN